MKKVEFENRCQTCLMPGEVVSLNEKGCSYCAPEEKREEFKVENFIHNSNKGRSVEDIKKLAAGSTGNYDCLVGVTGGRDSAFLLYYVKEILGLNPLAVNFNTGFTTEEALVNMENLTTKLGVDFIRYKGDGKFLQKAVRGFFKNYGEVCSVCHQGHFYVLAKFARENGIKVIIRGISSKTDMNQQDLNYSDYFCKDEKEFNSKLLTIKDQESITDEELERNHHFLNIEDWLYNEENVYLIDLPDLLSYEYDEIEKTIQEKIGDWKYPENQTLHADCKINPILCHCQYTRHGYSEKQVIISNLLRHGDISVDRGKELLSTEEMINMPSTIDEVLNILDVDMQTFNNVLETIWKK